MNLVETIRTTGKNITSSLNGQIQLDEAQGRLVARDTQSREMTIVDFRGISTVEPTTGMHRGRWGISTTDYRPFGGFSKTGQDIRTLLGEPTDI